MHYDGVGTYSPAVSNEFTLLGLISLEPGTWADWFSGLMSFAAVAVALGGYWIARLHRRADERDRDYRAAEAVGWKALQVLNHTGNVSRHLKASLARSSERPKPVMQFMHVQPLGIPMRSVPELTADELSILLKAKAAPILMELADCISRYESIRYAMQEYKSRHEAFFELLPTPFAGDGATFTHFLDPDQHARVTPYARMLDALLYGIIDLVRENMEKSVTVLDGIGPAMKAHFGEWKLSFEDASSEKDPSESNDPTNPPPKSEERAG